jgi:transposase
MIKRILALKTKEMEKRLKQSLGIDVSKLNLSLSLGFLHGDLGKKFEVHPDITNDLSGFKELHRWLKKSVDPSVDMLIVMEATGVYHQGVAHCTNMVMPFV